MDLANLLYPHTAFTPEELETRYPERHGDQANQRDI